MPELVNPDFAGGEVLLIDKPKGWTSFDVVNKVRKAIKVKKVGHAGTLDPLATGLLILCTGKKTKTIDSILGQEKEYRVDIRFGATTPSFDAEFPPENPKDCSDLTAGIVDAAMGIFRGEISQIPPAFSAVKVNGTKAYHAARQGKPLDLKPRPVTIFEFELERFEAPDFAVARIRCSKGTYIRSLVHDLGQTLGCGAFILELRRTAIGDHRIEEAWNLPDFLQAVQNLSPQTPAQ